jgi:hypothetical protein
MNEIRDFQWVFRVFPSMRPVWQGAVSAPDLSPEDASHTAELTEFFDLFCETFRLPGRLDF